MKSLSNCACKTFLCTVAYPFHFVVPETCHQQLFPGSGHPPTLSTQKDLVHVFIADTALCTILDINIFLKIDCLTPVRCRVVLEIGMRIL